MVRIGLAFICLVAQTQLAVRITPPEVEVREGEAFTLDIVISKTDDEPWPARVHPFLQPPEGISLLGASARSDSGPDPAGAAHTLAYTVRLQAIAEGEWKLENVGIEYLDSVSAEERDLMAGPVSVRVLPGRFLGIGAGWVLAGVIFLGMVLAGSIWLGGLRNAAPQTAEPSGLDREGAWQAMEDIRRFRIRGEDLQLLEKILELESLLPDQNADMRKDLKNKIEGVKYGGQRLSPAELEEVYRRVERKVKSEFPKEEDETAGQRDG